MERRRPAPEDADRRDSAHLERALCATRSRPGDAAPLVLRRADAFRLRKLADRSVRRAASSSSTKRPTGSTALSTIVSGARSPNGRSGFATTFQPPTPTGSRAVLSAPSPASTRTQRPRRSSRSSRGRKARSACASRGRHARSSAVRLQRAFGCRRRQDCCCCPTGSRPRPPSRSAATRCFSRRRRRRSAVPPRMSARARRSE